MNRRRDAWRALQISAAGFAFVALTACAGVRGEMFTGSNTHRVLQDIARSQLPDADKRRVGEALDRASVGAYTLSGKTVGQVVSDESAFDVLHSTERLRDLLWYSKAFKGMSEAQTLLTDALSAVDDHNFSSEDTYLNRAQEAAQSAEGSTVSDFSVPDGWDDVADYVNEAEQSLSNAIHTFANCGTFDSAADCDYTFRGFMVNEVAFMRDASRAAEQHYRALGGEDIDDAIIVCEANADPAIRSFELNHQNSLPRSMRQSRQEILQSVQDARRTCGDARAWRRGR